MAVADVEEAVAGCIRMGSEPGSRACHLPGSGDCLCPLFLNDHHGHLGFGTEDIVDSHQPREGQGAERAEEDRNYRP